MKLVKLNSQKAVDDRMECINRRAELMAEIAELQHQQLESFAAATFAGFTSEQNTAHNQRSDHLEARQRALAPLR